MTPPSHPDPTHRDDPAPDAPHAASAPRSTAVVDEPVEYDLPEDDAPWEAHEDEPAELPARPRRRLVTPAAIGLAGVVLAAGGFIGGVQVQKHSDDGGGAPAGFAAARGGAAGGQGGGAPGATGGGSAAGGSAAGGGSTAGGAAAGGGTASASGTGATTGTVSTVKGKRLYVEGTDGTTVEVTVGSQATVQRLAKSTASGVHPGDTVIVQGTTKSDGGIAATAVQATAAGTTTLANAFGGGGGAPGGAAGSGSSGSGSSGSGSSGSDSDSGDPVGQLFDGG